MIAAPIARTKVLRLLLAPISSSTLSWLKLADHVAAEQVSMVFTYWT